MASRRRSPADAAGHVSAGLRAHRTPIGVARALTGIGDVGRAAMRFSALTFLSASARRRQLASGAQTDRMLVRPPDFWAGERPADEAADGSKQIVRTGDAAFDALLAKRRSPSDRGVGSRNASAPQPRGLPSTVHRRGVSAAGPLTGPGSVVRRLQPAPVPPAPNPATTGGTSATTTTSTPATPRRPRSRHGATRQPSPSRGSDDRPGHGVRPTPSAPPATPRVSRSVSTPSFDALIARAVAESPEPEADVSPSAPVISVETLAAYQPRAAVGTIGTARAAMPLARLARRQAARRETSGAPVPRWSEVSRLPVLGGALSVGLAAAAADAARSDRDSRHQVASFPRRTMQRNETRRAASTIAPVVRRESVLPRGSNGPLPNARLSDASLALPSSTTSAPRRAAAPARSLEERVRMAEAAIARRDVSSAFAAVTSPGARTAATEVVVRSGARRAPAERAPLVRRTLSLPNARVADHHALPETEVVRRLPAVATPTPATVAEPAADTATERDALVRRELALPPAGAVAAVPSVPEPDTDLVHRSPLAPPAVQVASTNEAAGAQPTTVTAREVTPQSAVRQPAATPVRRDRSLAGPSNEAAATLPSIAEADSDDEVGSRDATAASAAGGPSALVRRDVTLPSSAAPRESDGRADPAPDTELVHRAPLAPPAVIAGEPSAAAPDEVVRRDVTLPSTTSSRDETRAREATATSHDLAAAGPVAPADTPAGAGTPSAPSALVRRDLGLASSTDRTGAATVALPVPDTDLVQRAELAPPAVVTHAAPLDLAATSPAVADALPRDRAGAPTGTIGTSSSEPSALVRRDLALPSAAGDAASAVTSSAAPDAELVRRQPLAPPALVAMSAPHALVRRTMGLPTARMVDAPTSLRHRTVRRERAASPHPTHGSHASKDSYAPHASFVRRTLSLPTAAVADDLVDATARSDAVRRLTVAPPAVGTAVERAGSPTADRELTLVARAVSLRNTATAVTRRSMTLPTAPAGAATRVLPGVRSTSPKVARWQQPTLADRVREVWGDDTPTPAAAAPAAPASRRSAREDRGESGSSPTRTERTAASAAARFESVLRDAPRVDRPVALPARFRPLADRIVGRKVAVKVVHGSVTRQALAAAGHDAATTDRTIHLPSRPDASTRTMSIVAHELEHVAAPSPTPRFHGGVDSPEERRATAMEQVVRRLATTADRPRAVGTAGLPVGGLTAFGRAGSGVDAATIARSPSASPPGPPVPASALHRQVSAAASTSAPDTVNRTAAASATSGGTRSSNRTIRREGVDDPMQAMGGSSDSSGAPAISPAVLSAIIRAVEDRLLDEIERRGGLRRGGF